MDVDSPHLPAYLLQVTFSPHKVPEVLVAVQRDELGRGQMNCWAIRSRVLPISALDAWKWPVWMVHLKGKQVDKG